MPPQRPGYRQRGAARDRIADLLMQASAPLETDAIAARLRVTRGHVTAQLAELEALGWVERTRAAAAGQPDRWSWRRAQAA